MDTLLCGPTGGLETTGSSTREHAVSYQGNSPGGPAPGQPKPKKKWPWIGLLIALVVLLAAGALGALVSKKKAEIAAQRDRFETGAVAAEPPPPPPPKPGSPVSCRKDRPTSTLKCFPEDIDPEVVLDAVAGEVGWQCLRQNETDDDGNRILEPRTCQGVNNVDQPYELKESISYETSDYQPGSPLKTISLEVMTSAAEHNGQHTTPRDPNDALVDFFARANSHIWQGKPQLQQEATATFEQIKPRCSTTEGRSIAGVSATTPSGYKIECSSPGGSVAVGDAITYGQQVKIDAK